MAFVTFTPNLQRHVAAPAVEAEGSTVREVLEQVFVERPRLRGYVVDERGVLRKHMVVFVNGEQVNDRERQSDPVKASDEIHVMQALSGG